jgi:ketosteroid isomerase-like protein
MIPVPRATTFLMMAALAGPSTGSAGQSAEQDKAAVASLDTEYQAAVKRNDAQTMDRIMHEQFLLVLGDGRTVSRQDLIEEARQQHLSYEQQDEETGTQVVRVWGDTAVVTAKLWIKGSRDGVIFERKLWFSDTYVRTPTGWKYAFGQASLSLPQ